MALWTSFHSLIFRSAKNASEINATAPITGDKLYRECEVVARFAPPSRNPLGRRLVYAGNRIAVATGIVQRILPVDTLPFYTLASPLTAAYQDIGIFYNLEAVLYGLGFGPTMRHKYICLYETRQYAGNPASGPILRAGEHANDVLGENDFWTSGAPNIVLPWQCWYKQKLGLSNGKNGLSNCTFELEGAMLDDA